MCKKICCLLNPFPKRNGFSRLLWGRFSTIYSSVAFSSGGVITILEKKHLGCNVGWSTVSRCFTVYKLERPISRCSFFCKKHSKEHKLRTRRSWPSLIIRIGEYSSSYMWELEMGPINFTRSKNCCLDRAIYTPNKLPLLSKISLDLSNHFSLP